MRFIAPEEVLAGAPEAARHLRLPFCWQVEVRQGGKLHRLGVEPDRVFGLRFEGAPENPQQAYFFLEGDRNRVGGNPGRIADILLLSSLGKLFPYFQEPL